MSCEDSKTDARQGVEAARKDGAAHGCGGAHGRQGAEIDQAEVQGAARQAVLLGGAEHGTAGGRGAYQAGASAASTAAYMVGAANLVVGSAGTIVAAIFVNGMAAVGFAVGYIIGIANIWLLLSIAKKGIRMTPNKAGRYVASRYYIRYVATIAVFSVLITTGLVGAWPALSGITVCIFATIAAMIFIFSRREEVF